jgi:hypothetical protein
MTRKVTFLFENIEKFEVTLSHEAASNDVEVTAVLTPAAQAEVEAAGWESADFAITVDIAHVEWATSFLADKVIGARFF